jgi:hypothetical protein
VGMPVRGLERLAICSGHRQTGHRHRWHRRGFCLFWTWKVRRGQPGRPAVPKHVWRTFLENHVKTMVSLHFSTVPTISFQVLYVFLVLAHDRRRIVPYGQNIHAAPQ